MTPINVLSFFLSLMLVLGGVAVLGGGGVGGGGRDTNSLCKCVLCSDASRCGRVLQVSTIHSAVFLPPPFPVE